MSQRISLIPPGGENVETDLPADGVGQAKIWELGFERRDEGGADLVRFVVCFEGVAFGDAGGGGGGGRE